MAVTQFKSPQLLMVSGIGPAETLQKQGVQVLSDLSGVGQNLWVSSRGSALRAGNDNH